MNKRSYDSRILPLSLFYHFALFLQSFVFAQKTVSLPLDHFGQFTCKLSLISVTDRRLLSMQGRTLSAILCSYLISDFQKEEFKGTNIRPTDFFITWRATGQLVVMCPIKIFPHVLSLITTHNHSGVQCNFYMVSKNLAEPISSGSPGCAINR